MQLNEYARRTVDTAIYPGAGQQSQQEFAYLGLGLAGETGEVVEKIKKYIRDGTLNREDVIKELGDIFWYLCRLSMAFDADPETVLELNYDKLQKRKANNTLKGSGDGR